MAISIIRVRAADGPLAVRLSCPRTPQSLAGVLWRYGEDENPKGKAGEFTPRIPVTPIGSLASVKGDFFQIEGVVIAQSDNPPTPYQVVVSILLNGQSVNDEVPEDGGTGSVGKEDQTFAYAFQIREAT